MPNRARHLKAVPETTAARSRHSVRCSVCERRIETEREANEVMVRCRHCGTLQHRRVGKEAEKRPRSR